jgi:hypothetical protein
VLNIAGTGHNPNTSAQAAAVADITSGKTALLPNGGGNPSIANDWTLAANTWVNATVNYQIGLYNFSTAGMSNISQGNWEFDPSIARSGAVTAPPAGFPPAGLGDSSSPSPSPSESSASPSPAPTDNHSAQVTSVTSTVGATTPRWNLDLTIGLQNAACPAKVKLALGNWTKTISACGADQVPPSSFHFLWKVFDASHSLTPKASTTVTASVVSSKAPSYGGSNTTLTIPDAPVWGGGGDSYSSGHRQYRDNITCIPQELPIVGPCHPDSLLENDASFSWVTRAVTALNKNVPAQWRYRLLLVAQSGATTRQMFEQGQIDAITHAIAARGRTWSVISFTGGANNARFDSTLRDFYRANFPLEATKPWGVKDWSKCPDTQTLYNRLLDQESTIRSDLAQIVALGRQASPSVRFVDMMYPYALKTDNVCNQDRQIPDPNNLSQSQTWHGAGSFIDTIDSLHQELSGPDIIHVDLRPIFGANPLPRTQQTRYFGYPHPNDAGQSRMASAAVSALP